MSGYSFNHTTANSIWQLGSHYRALLLFRHFSGSYNPALEVLNDIQHPAAAYLRRILSSSDPIYRTSTLQEYAGLVHIADLDRAAEILIDSVVQLFVTSQRAGDADSLLASIGILGRTSVATWRVNLILTQAMQPPLHPSSNTGGQQMTNSVNDRFHPNPFTQQRPRPITAQQPQFAIDPRLSAPTINSQTPVTTFPSGTSLRFVPEAGRSSSALRLASRRRSRSDSPSLPARKLLRAGEKEKTRTQRKTQPAYDAPAGQRWRCPFPASTDSTRPCGAVFGARNDLVRHVKEKHHNGQAGWGSSPADFARCGPYTLERLRQLGHTGQFKPRPSIKGDRAKVDSANANLAGNGTKPSQATAKKTPTAKQPQESSNSEAERPRRRGTGAQSVGQALGPAWADKDKRWLCPFHASTDGSGTRLCTQYRQKRGDLRSHVRDLHGPADWGVNVEDWSNTGPYNMDELRARGVTRGFRTWKEKKVVSRRAAESDGKEEDDQEQEESEKEDDADDDDENDGSDDDNMSDGDDHHKDNDDDGRGGGSAQTQMIAVY